METAKIIKKGDRQFIVLPEKCRIHGDEATITRKGDQVVLTPAVSRWDSFFHSLEEFSEDFLEGDRAQPVVQKRRFDQS